MPASSEQQDVSFSGSTIYPLLPLRDIVVFPTMIAPLFVGRKRSIHALEHVIKTDKKILLVTQQDAANDDPKISDLYKVGVLANVLQLLKLPDGTIKVLVEGAERVKILEFMDNQKFFCARIEPFEDILGDEKDIKALTRSVMNQFGRYAKLNKKIAPEVMGSLAQIKDPSRLADTITSHLALENPDKQVVLEIANVMERLEKVYGFMEAEIEVLNAEQKIRSRVKGQMEKTQKEYYLNEQLKAIHKELGESEDGKDELLALKERIEKMTLPKEVKERAEADLRKLRAMAPMSAEATVVRNYLDCLLDLPWGKYSTVKPDLQKAEEVLDKDHYGLEKVKERIIEFIAVQQRTKKLKGPILCLVGPPGVGKTSLAKSIAMATGRKFIKFSLGGVRDEAEIRGHRRTYIGSMPGKIIQSLRKVGTSNPVMLLDEIDKLGIDFRGDPASALLEVLDSEQNTHFNDHYLEVDFNLSDVMFVATANSLNIPHALLDRMEVIRISGYTEQEKIEIAKRHLLPKEIIDHGLKKNEWSVSEDAIQEIIRYYTREAGVRNLERELARLARKAVRRILSKKLKTVDITQKNIKEFLGPRKTSFGETEEKDMIGIVNGLAYTEAGGDILMIEAVQLPGKGDIKSTGKLGDVMQESAQAAFSYVRSRSTIYGITPPQYQKKDIHIHVPEGATPKDGPSAGVAMCTAIISILTGIPVRRTVAMTGEITLRGRVLAIGGLKEKLLAAHRSGIKTVCLPEENRKDLDDLPAIVKEQLELVFVSNVEDVLKVALDHMPAPVEWNEVEGLSIKQDDVKHSPLVTH